MGYQHGRTTQPAPILTIEKARRLNAELRRELATLIAEKTHLAPQVEAMRGEVTAARKKLARQIRDLEVIRAQTARLAIVAQNTASNSPAMFGGREGLQAAADEIKAYEEGGLNLTTVPRGRKGPRHGTARRYGLGCRCESCLAWRQRKTAQEVARNKARREEFRSLQASAEAAA